MSKFLCLFLVVNIFSLSCSLSKRESKQTSKVQQDQQQEKNAATGLFSCNAKFTSCRVTNNHIASSPGISATWHITYDFPCLTGGEEFDSPIELRVGNNYRRLVFGKVGAQIEIDGDESLSVIDTDPPLTSSWFFDYGTNCGLTIAYAITPSLHQVTAWGELADAYTSMLRTSHKIYSFKAQVSDWYEKNLSNPGQNKAVIAQVISSLQPLADTDEVVKTYIRSLQDILDNAPSAAIFGPYETARISLIEVIEKSKSLRATMERWVTPIKASFIESIVAATVQMER